jgi:5'-nucleotidase/UDP-sugar diphosphatase
MTRRANASAAWRALPPRSTRLRDELTAAGENVIVLDAGDQYQGSLFFTTYDGAAAGEFMEAIGFDAMALGNHEFNNGPEGMIPLLDAGHASRSSPATSTSAVIPRSNGRVGDTLILDVNGVQVGIVSALSPDTQEISSPGDTVVFMPEIAAMQADVDALTAEGVDIIIGLTHVGLPADIRIAEAVTGLDVIVGGHSHTYLSATTRTVTGPIPPGSPTPMALVPIVQAGAYLEIPRPSRSDLRRCGQCGLCRGDTMVLDASVTPDEAIAARVAELAGPIEEAMGELVGETTEFIEGDRSVCRAMECPMGNLVADAMLERVADQGIQIAIQNGGGLRASIDSGEVTMGEVFTVLPFQNTLATFQLTGAGVMEALENGVSQVEEGAGRFPQVAGLRYTWDPAAEPGSRIVFGRGRHGRHVGSRWTWRPPTAWCPTTSCAAAATGTAVFIGR